MTFQEEIDNTFDKSCVFQYLKASLSCCLTLSTCPCPSKKMKNIQQLLILGDPDRRALDSEFFLDSLDIVRVSGEFARLEIVFLQREYV